jgi:hypothetical protein
MDCIYTRTAKLYFEGNTLFTEMFDNVEIDINDARENYEASVKLTNEKKYLSLVIAAPFVSITKEAREEVNKALMYKNTIAQAIIVKSMANRLMGNFLVKLYKPHCPLKLFSNKEDAIAWLNEKFTTVLLKS